MATTPTSTDRQSSARFDGLEPEALIRAFRIMHTARRLDDREITLKRQNLIFFQASGAGHEAVQAAAGMVLRPGQDWVYPYYRDRALCLALGVTPYEMLLQAVGAASDPASGGRQMPSHWGAPKLNIVTSSSPTGTQFVQAVGCAEAGRFRQADSGELTLVTGGDGATSEGEFWESMNAACLSRLPVLFLIEDNGYAISVPVECQTVGGNISPLLSGFPALFRQEIDGTDFFASHRALREAAAYCRSGRGPALVHAHVVRLYSHSLSDDERMYKTDAERKAESARDPVLNFPKLLVDEGILDRQALQRIVHEIDEEIHAATEEALRQDPPARDSVFVHLYSEQVDPTADAFEAAPHFTGDPKTMVDMINATLGEEMRRNPDVLVFGEDIADCSREEILKEVKGKGGVFKVTAGLQIEFGSRRVFNTPLAEASIVGRAIGMATRGLKPVAEVQFFDYLWPAMMQIRDELATIRWRSNGGFSSPVVLRVPIGGYLNGGAIYHSQCGEVEFNRSPHPGPEFTIPFGRAKIVKTGQNLTIVTYGAVVQKALQAAMQVERKNPDASIEVMDLRSLAPYDWNAIRSSVEKTSRVLVAHEDTISFGYGAEIAARIADELFDRLDAPVRRVGALDTWVGYHPQLENTILPQVDDLAREAERLLAY